MRKIYIFLMLLVILAVANSPSHATTVAEQITNAIAKGDYKTVQSLVNSNPGTTGQAENALLSQALDNLTTQPQKASQAMTVASSLTSGIKPSDAPAIVEKLKKIVKVIVDKSLLICNPETNADTSQLQTPLDPKKVADAQAIASIMEAAEAIAQTPAIVAVDPKLFAEIQEKSGQCIADEALLAQKPGYRAPHAQPRLQQPGFPPPPPPKNQASPG